MFPISDLDAELHCDFRRRVSPQAHTVPHIRGEWNRENSRYPGCSKETAYNGSMYGFSLLPDSITENKIIAWNNTHFPEPLFLDSVFTKAHMTLVQAPFRRGFNPKDAMEELAEQFKSEPKTWAGTLKQDRDYIFLTMQNPEWMSKLNELAVNSVKDQLDLADVPKPKIFENEKEQKSWELTGYRFNLEAYDPHFTVGISDEPAALPPTGLEGERVSFRKLVFSEHGPHGRISRIIETVHLPFSWD